jgi:hypothetical protein
LTSPDKLVFLEAIPNEVCCKSHSDDYMWPVIVLPFVMDERTTTSKHDICAALVRPQSVIP